MAEDQGTDPVLSKIDPEKRQFIGKLIGTTAFVAPLVASFAMGNLTIHGGQTVGANVRLMVLARPSPWPGYAVDR